MRKRFKLFILLPIIFFLLICFTQTGQSQSDQLVIEITNDSYEPIEELYEQENFIVSVYVLEEGGIPSYLTGVTIQFDENNYQIPYGAEDPEVIIIAPEVTQDTDYIIQASKNDYNSDSTILTVLDKIQLVIIADSYTVEAGKQFSVLVTDKSGQEISDVTVGIVSVAGQGSIGTTNENGRVWLTAPQDRNEINIIAQKQGYKDAIPITLGVNKNPGFIDTLIQNQYFPLLLAFFFLGAAILYVNYRHRRSHPLFQKMDSKKDDIFNTRKNKTDEKLNSSDFDPGPKIEEIRITRNKDDKNIVSLSQQKEIKENHLSKKQKMRKYQDEWFEGTNDIRYEIDRITKQIDDKGKDNWFHGTDDIRKKIDMKIRNKDSEKNNK
ncbi:MAG: carboxypeptidase regulatory-like domain-containing protein [Candidatus Thermoplasmatota archaeon]|nr:carboxypeptidase regulatory-like domain-containing protein [Candidatus Thermoplasmatota archaeon]